MNMTAENPIKHMNYRQGAMGANDHYQDELALRTWQKPSKSLKLPAERKTITIQKSLKLPFEVSQWKENAIFKIKKKKNRTNYFDLKHKELDLFNSEKMNK